MACFSRAPLHCHPFEIQLQKQADSILSSVGSWQCIENGVTRDSTVKAGMGQLTGRGNRRPEVIGDVTSRGRKSISIGGIWCIPIQLVSPLTNVGQEKCLLACRVRSKSASVSLSEPAWSLNVCFDDFQLYVYLTWYDKSLCHLPSGLQLHLMNIFCTSILLLL